MAPQLPPQEPPQLVETKVLELQKPREAQPGHCDAYWALSEPHVGVTGTMTGTGTGTGLQPVWQEPAQF